MQDTKLPVTLGKPTISVNDDGKTDINAIPFIINQPVMSYSGTLNDLDSQLQAAQDTLASDQKAIDDLITAMTAAFQPKLDADQLAIDNINILINQATPTLTALPARATVAPGIKMTPATETVNP